MPAGKRRIFECSVEVSPASVGETRFAALLSYAIGTERKRTEDIASSQEFT